MINADLGDDRPDFLTGGGDMAALIRDYDWSTTSLGPLADWRVEIKSVVAMMLHSPLPMLAG